MVAASAETLRFSGAAGHVTRKSTHILPGDAFAGEFIRMRLTKPSCIVAH
jgi:hypothetical protein